LNSKVKSDFRELMLSDQTYAAPTALQIIKRIPPGATRLEEQALAPGSHSSRLQRFA
jgi:hypothetical protein